MSRYDWQHGTIKLPSSVYSKFRQHMQAADQRHKEAVFALTQDFWKSLTRTQQTNLDAYREAVYTWSQRNQTTDRYGVYIESETITAARFAIEPHTYRTPGKPKRVLRASADFPTNRTLTFGNMDATVTFHPDTKSVTWDVDEGNRACESAAESALGKAFFGYLDTIRWTRGTGGVIVGNDEYNRDTEYAGGGANYVTHAYGYVGITEAPQHVRPFRNAKGQQVRAKITHGRYGFAGKAVTQ